MGSAVSLSPRSLHPICCRLSARGAIRGARYRVDRAQHETPAHLSLASSCRRGWGSLYDALNAGTLDLTRLETLVTSYPLPSATTWYAGMRLIPACGHAVTPKRARIEATITTPLALARDAVTDVCSHWPPLPVERRTPARVRRGVSQLLPYSGSPHTCRNLVAGRADVPEGSACDLPSASRRSN